MVEASITERRRMTRWEREKAASRSAAWREAHRDRPDVRAVDKAVSEAVAVYALDLPPEESKAFVAKIVGLATGGLDYQSYDKAVSREQTVRRLASWTSGPLSSGGVKTALERKRLKAARDAINSQYADTLVTSSYGTTETEAA